MTTAVIALAEFSVFTPLGGEKSKIEKFQLNIYFCIPMMYVVLKFQNVQKMDCGRERNQPT